jgi:biotin carboxylase
MHVVLVGPRKEVVRGLREDGHEITVLYEGAHRQRVFDLGDQIDRACAVDSYTKVDSLWSALHHLSPPRPVDAVVTTTEWAVVAAAVLGHLIGARAVSPRQALACRDKAVQKDAWNLAGIPTADWHVAPTGIGTRQDAERVLAESELHFPLVVKPLAGGASKSVSVVRDVGGLHRAASAVDDGGRVLVEQFVDGPEWHFDGVVDRDELCAFMVSRYCEPLLCTKSGRPSRSITYTPARHRELYAEAADLTCRALRALGLDRGVFHFEVFGGPGAFVASELACRPAGGIVGMMSERVIGVDMYAASARVITGDRIPRGEGERELTHGWTFLPTAPGRVNHVDPEEIRRIPGVNTVIMRVGRGEPMRDMAVASTVGVGFAAVHGGSVEDCERAIDDVVAAVERMHAGAPFTADAA